MEERLHMSLRDVEVFIPTQTPTGHNIGEIVARLEEIEIEEKELREDIKKLESA